MMTQRYPDLVDEQMMSSSRNDALDDSSAVLECPAEASDTALGMNDHACYHVMVITLEIK
jgi:hypothetical protein